MGTLRQAFLVGGKLVGDVFQEDEGAEPIRNCQTAAAMLPACAARSVRPRVRAGVFGRFDLGDGFKYAVILRKGGAAGGAQLVAALLHFSGFQRKERCKQIVGVTAKKRAGQALRSCRCRKQAFLTRSPAQYRPAAS